MNAPKTKSNNNNAKRAEAASSQKGEDRVAIIIEAARKVFIEEGRQGFSMRRIASEAGIAVGNLQYYYKSKSDILKDMLDSTIAVYENAFDDIMEDDASSYEQKLHQIIHHIVIDLSSRETTRFYPELWALANHDEYAAHGLHVLYQRARHHIRILVKGLNSKLDNDQCRIVALIISASLEGHTMFIGFEKPWQSTNKVIAEILSKQFTHMAKTLTSADFSKGDLIPELPSEFHRI